MIKIKIVGRKLKLGQRSSATINLVYTFNVSDVFVELVLCHKTHNYSKRINLKRRLLELTPKKTSTYYSLSINSVTPTPVAIRFKKFMVKKDKLIPILYNNIETKKSWVPEKLRNLWK